MRLNNQLPKFFLPVPDEPAVAPDLANFFVHLHDVRGLKANMIVGYHSAINSVLKLHSNEAGLIPVVS